MTPEDYKELKESNNGCNDCIFCFMKCPECGSVDIEATFLNEFSFNGSGTRTEINCNDCGELSESAELPGYFDKDIDRELVLGDFEYVLSNTERNQLCFRSMDDNPEIDVKFIRRDTEKKVDLFEWNYTTFQCSEETI